LIGLAETMIGGYVTPLGSDLALGGALVIIIVVLLVKPTGLFGSQKPERV
jgi:branched-chain amino acid transport system permease protein